MRNHACAIEWDRKAAKVLEGITDKKLKEYVIDALENVVARDPLVGKPLVGPLKGVRSYRI